MLMTTEFFSYPYPWIMIASVVSLETMKDNG